MIVAKIWGKSLESPGKEVDSTKKPIAIAHRITLMISVLSTNFFIAAPYLAQPIRSKI